jgi:hypothetical protein
MSARPSSSEARPQTDEVGGIAYSATHGIDLFVGRRTHRLFRAAGVVDIRVDATAHVYPPGHDRRLLLRDFISNVRAKLIEESFIEAAELEGDMAALERHVSNPETLVASPLFIQMSGRVPSVP